MNSDFPDRETDVIPYSDMNNIIEIIKKKNYPKWFLEQTKEARFLPSLIQDQVQIGIIIDSDNPYVKELLKGDILNENLSAEIIKPLINPDYYEKVWTKIEEDNLFEKIINYYLDY